MKSDFALAKEELSQIGIKRVAADFCQEPRRKGSCYFVKSPATHDKTESLAIYPNSNRFCDFANGNRSGDIIGFVSYIKGCNNWQALKELQAYYGLTDSRERDKKEAQRHIQLQQEQERRKAERRQTFYRALQGEIDDLKWWAVIYSTAIEKELFEPFSDEWCYCLNEKQKVEYRLDILCAAEFAAKIGAKGDYWASRMLSDISEQNGIDPADIGIESTYDTKMSVLDQLTDQLNRIFKYYGTNDPEERPKVNHMYLNDTIIERAKAMYGGEIGKLSDNQKANKAYFAVRTQNTDIQKGIAISNVLRNAKGEVKNMILCRLAEDNSISSMAAEFSGHFKEIEEFKNGKAHEYRKAEREIENIRKTKDVAVIRQTAEEYSDNEFFLSGKLKREAHC